MANYNKGSWSPYHVQGYGKKIDSVTLFITKRDNCTVNSATIWLQNDTSTTSLPVDFSQRMSETIHLPFDTNETLTEVKIHRTEIRKVKDCKSDHDYNQLICGFNYFRRKLREHCQCDYNAIMRTLWFPYTVGIHGDGLQECSNKTQLRCIQSLSRRPPFVPRKGESLANFSENTPFYREYNEDPQWKCPTPCDQVIFTVMQSDLRLKRRPNQHQIRFVYASPSIQRVDEQRVLNDWLGMCTDIGGTISPLLGTCVMTILQVVDELLQMISVQLCGTRKRD